MNIVIIGAQKAGTTWLYSMLRQNPAVATAFQKEIHYFDNRCSPDFKFEKYRRFVTSKMRRLNQLDRPGFKDYLEYCLDETTAFTDEWYRNIFLMKPRNRRMLSKGMRLSFMDASPSYMAMPEDGVAHMAAAIGQAVPIMMVRDPVKRMISGLTMQLLRDQERGVIKPHENIILAQQVPRGSYSTAIPRFRRHFGELHIIPFNDIQTRPTAVLQSIESRFSLPAAEYSNQSKKNNSKSGKVALSDETMAFIKRVCEPEYSYLTSEFGIDFLNRI